MPSDETVWTQETVARRLSEHHPSSPAPTGGEELRLAYRQAAAVLTYFDPGTLRPFGLPPDETGAFLYLMNDSAAAPGQKGSRRWTLLPEVRHEALSRLGTPEAVRAARAANLPPGPGDPSPEDDPLQEMVDAYIFGTAPPPEEQDADQLTRSLQAVQWFGHVLGGMPEAATIQQLLARRRLREPFEHLVGDRFRGRVEDLRALREYVGVLPPETLRGRLSQQFEQWGSLREKPPFVIHGAGGVGKSTLISKFILDHLDAHPNARFPFVYLDFDSPYLFIEDPISLLVEAAKQLRVQYPDQQKLFEDLQHRLERRAVGAHEVDPGSSPASEDIFTEQSRKVTRQEMEQSSFRDFAILLNDLARDGKPVYSPCLLVLDTFEEVQYRSTDKIPGLAKLLGIVQSQCPTVRIVVSGRAPASDLKVNDRAPLERRLSDFDLDSARGFLEGRGVTDEALARSIYNSVGGNPLNLTLAAEVVRKEGPDQEVLKDLSPSRFSLEALTSLQVFFAQESVVQGRLYRRILGYIHDPDVRRLAHPGLVLRRITPDIIQRVLAKPCGVEIRTPARAQELFTELSKEVSLVTYEEDGSLRHRQDVRRVMLNMLVKDKPRQVKQIHRAAIDYYVGEEGDIARAEEIYHRLQLSEDVSEVEGRWVESAARYLREAAEELPARAQVYLATKISNLLVDEYHIKRYAAQQEWELYVTRRAQEALDEGDVERALTLLHERRDASSGSGVLHLEAKALALAGRFAEAKLALTGGVEAASREGDRDNLLKLLILGADIDAQLGDHYSGDSKLAAAEKIAAQAGYPDATFGILLSRLRLRPENSNYTELLADRPQLSERLAAAFMSMPDRQLTHRKTLARRAVGELGGVRPDILLRGLRTVGMGRLTTRQVRLLARGLAAAAAGNENLKKLGELLARTLGLSLKDFRAEDTWLEFLKGAAKAQRLDEFMQRIIGEDISQRGAKPGEDAGPGGAEEDASLSLSRVVSNVMRS